MEDVQNYRGVHCWNTMRNRKKITGRQSEFCAQTTNHGAKMSHTARMEKTTVQKFGVTELCETLRRGGGRAELARCAPQILVSSILKKLWTDKVKKATQQYTNLDGRGVAIFQSRKKYQRKFYFSQKS